jgi:hypothetical protein
MSRPAPPADIVDELVARLRDGSRAEPPATFPRDVASAGQPGLYSWWCDAQGLAQLGAALDAELPPLIYAGLAGATKWPSGRPGTATLFTPIGGMHLGQKIDFSTFRWTLAALLRTALGLQHIAPRRLAPASESALTDWMIAHLQVVAVPYPDRATLGVVEEAVLEALDPPLNLMGMRLTPLRQRLKELRSLLATSPAPSGLVEEMALPRTSLTPLRRETKLVVAPCGRQKIWDQNPSQGPTPAKDAYTSPLFRRFSAYAENYGDAWIILSAKYGFIEPEFLIPKSYNVTFNDPSTNPVTVEQLRSQVQQLGLDQFGEIVGLGGASYRGIIETVFGPTGAALSFPFTRLPIGKPLQALDRVLSDSTHAAAPLDQGRATSSSRLKGEHGRARWRDIVLQADHAKRTLSVDRTEGEKEFEQLLEQYPQDGMVYLRRGEARLEVGDVRGANSDLLRAEELLPRPKWKQRARDARQKLLTTGDGVRTVEVADFSGYGRLTVWLMDATTDRVRVTFADIVAILGRPLPASAST